MGFCSFFFPNILRGQTVVNAVYQSYYAPDPSVQEPIITDDKTPDMHVFFDEETPYNLIKLFS